MARYRPPRPVAARPQHAGWRGYAVKLAAGLGAFALLAGVLVSVVPTGSPRAARPTARVGVYVCDAYRTDELARAELGRPTVTVSLPTTLGAELAARGARLTRHRLTLPPAGARRTPVRYQDGDVCGDEAGELKVFVWNAGATGEPSEVYTTVDPALALTTPGQTVVVALIAPSTPVVGIQPPGSTPAPFTP